MAFTNERRGADSSVALGTVLTSILIACVSATDLAQQTVATPHAFQTNARFTVDSDVLQLQTAVAIAEPPATVKNFSVVRIYFYAFPLTTDDVASLSNGSIAALERKRTSARGQPDLNHSRAVLNFLLDRKSALWNASLEVPGLTCTIVVEPAAAKSAVQVFELAGKQLHVEAKGSTTCDLTSINGSKRRMSWDVGVNVPVFTQRSARSN